MQAQLGSGVFQSTLAMAAGASVNDYYLASQMASGVKPPSHLAVASKSAALSNSRLQAVFELSLPYTASTLNSVGVIYAAGPVDSTGALQQHTYVICLSSKSSKIISRHASLLLYIQKNTRHFLFTKVSWQTLSLAFRSSNGAQPHGYSVEEEQLSVGLLLISLSLSGYRATLLCLQYSGALLDLTKGLSSFLGPALAPQAESPATAPSPATTAAGETWSCQFHSPE